MAQADADSVGDEKSFHDALTLLQNREFLKSVKYQEQQTRANRAGCHPDIIMFERAFIRRLGKLYIPAFAHSMKRTPEEQTSLYIRGLSKLSGDRGPHVQGIAVDIVHSVKAWSVSERGWELIGHIGKEVAKSLDLEIEWGGDWKFFDPAHWQLPVHDE